MSPTVLWLCLLGFFPSFISSQNVTSKVVCFYDSRSHYREGSGKFLVADLEHSLNSCTHIVYGYAKLDGSDFTIKSLDPDLDLDQGKENYKAVTGLKKRFPGLHVLLSVGGQADTEGSDKYMALLRDPNRQGTFVTSARTMIQQYGFDGLDLAWQFPFVRVKQRSMLGSIWHKIKKTFGYAKGSKDLQANEHKAGFTSLIKQLKLAFKPDGYLLTVSVLPHTNYSIYFDPTEISQFVDGVNLFSFDFTTPGSKISPDVADYPAPLYPASEKHPENSVDHMVSWFLNNSLPADKLTLGIPTFGRTWKIDSTANETGIPPLHANGEGAEGHLTLQRGILSYPEICSVLQNPKNFGAKNLLHKVTDPFRNLGTYAYRHESSDTEGIWVGFEDTYTAAVKAAYARKKGLGGVAIVDVSMDDFRGVCNEDRFPILKAAKQVI